jgi:hypothetical protein
MRRFFSVLAGLVLALASQVAVFWAGVLIVQSAPFEPLGNLGPGSKPRRHPSGRATGPVIAATCCTSTS